MRILCLHGMGTSADIFRAQLSRITPSLEALGHELVFVDGLHDCDSTNDIKTVYPPRYLAYYPIAYPDLVIDAQDYIREIVEDEGPFDGVMGFSQGGALAASLMLEHSKTDPDSNLFSFGIFVNATLPFNRDDEDGLKSWERAKENHCSTCTHEFAGEVDAVDPLGFPQDLNSTILGRFHPSKTPAAKIGVPTVHVVGATDPYAPQSRVLATMCDPRESTVVEHVEAHRLPKDARACASITKSIASMLNRLTYVQ